MNRYIALQKIVELGSFTKAAEALGYTQSAISQMISSLEDELSIKLLYRSRVGVKLTLEGKGLYPLIQRTILQYQAMQEKAKEIKGLETGVIRIGTISSITCHWMPQLIKEFQAFYPNVQFILHQGDYSSIQEWIKVGAVDFGFITPDAVTGLQTITLKGGRWLVVLPENHKLASRSYVNLQEIVNEPYLLLEQGNFSEPMNAFHACNLEPNIKYRIHDDYAIMTMVEAGLGISILAELVLRRTNYNIVALPIDPPITRTIAIGYKDKNSLPIASKYFIEYLTSNIDKLP
ncbi:LysR family transcriptional regulator [Bacillus sp. 03113]|uniref:LysR family transcriptional regulator n=1 Tax=Bacillus sp. 03113 TaxID=2578211 RepID=UPI001143F604|nr:LysR family transcriptional regulator [Bacillus sp. 03113]